MLDVASLYSQLSQRLKRLEHGHYLDLRSYKRDRSVLFIRENDSRLRVIEKGFEQHDFQIEMGELKKVLKEMIKREFPRSQKLRLYEMGVFDEFRPSPGTRQKI